MVCRYKSCSRELPDDAVFCPYCGRKQEKEKLRGKRPNGSGTVYKLSGNRSRPWAVAKNKVIIGYYQTKKEAIDALGRAADTPISDKNNYTFAQVYEAWHKEYQKKATEEMYKKSSGWYKMCPDLHPKKYKDLRAEDFQTAMDKAAETRKRGTLTHLAALWSMMYKYADRENIAQKDYSSFVVLPKDDAEHHQPFTADEVEKIIKDGSDDAKAVMILIYTGMRIGELFKLKTSDYKSTHCIGGEKTKAGKERVIPVPSVAKPYFDYFASLGNDMLMPIKYNTFTNNRYPKLMQRLGIEGKSSHSCRATFATITSKSVSPNDLKKILGHTSFETTSKYYIHQDIDALVDAVNKAW